MKWEELKEQQCTIARTLAVVGDRWTLLILRNCFFGMQRFEQFQNNLGLTRHLLSERLKKLVEARILEKVPYQEKPLRYEYHLTTKGKDFYPVLIGLSAWGARWTSDFELPALPRIHRSCGHLMTPEFVCSHCGETIIPFSVVPPKSGNLVDPLEKLEKIAPLERIRVEENEGKA